VPDLPIAIQSAEDAELSAFLGDRLYEFNVDATGISDGELLSAVVRDDGGNIVAGVSGHTWGGCCEIRQLWVQEQQRGAGLGKGLMNAAEQEAIRRGCTQIVLATHSFQAPGFYENLGFERLAVVPNYPEGHDNILYIKPLRSGRPATCSGQLKRDQGKEER